MTPKKNPEDFLNEEGIEVPTDFEAAAEQVDEAALETYTDETIEVVQSEAAKLKESGATALEEIPLAYDLPEADINAVRAETNVDAALAENNAEVTGLVERTTEQLRSEEGAAAIEATPATDEGALEKQKTIEKFQEKRGNIFVRALTSDITNTGLNFVPFAGGAKMFVESVCGEELNGAEVKGAGSRILHGAVGLGSLALDFTGAGEALKVGVLAGKSIRGVQKIGSALAKRGAAKSSRVFEKTAAFMEKHPQMVAHAEKFVDGKIRQFAHAAKTYRPGEESFQQAA